MRQDQFLGEELSAAENIMATARFEVVPAGWRQPYLTARVPRKDPKRLLPPVISLSGW